MRTCEKKKREKLYPGKYRPRFVSCGGCCRGCFVEQMSAYGPAREHPEPKKFYKGQTVYKGIRFGKLMRSAKRTRHGHSFSPRARNFKNDERRSKNMSLTHSRTHCPPPCIYFLAFRRFAPSKGTRVGASRAPQCIYFLSVSALRALNIVYCSAFQRFARQSACIVERFCDSRTKIYVFLSV